MFPFVHYRILRNAYTRLIYSFKSKQCFNIFRKIINACTMTKSINWKMLIEFCTLEQCSIVIHPNRLRNEKTYCSSGVPIVCEIFFQFFKTFLLILNGYQTLKCRIYHNWLMFVKLFQPQFQPLNLVAFSKSISVNANWCGIWQIQLYYQCFQFI